MKMKFKDPVSGFTHLFGAFLSVVGLVVLLYNAITGGSVWQVVSFAIFGASMILLYTASSVYHLWVSSDRVNRILRKIDHMMIYVLIAGTYTPVCLVALRGPWGWSLFGSIWGLTIGGIFLKIFWMNAPRWLSTLIYTIMGWLVIIAFFPLIEAVSLEGVLWLIAGGVFYSVGATIYGTKWPGITSKWFGFHEIFHLFVMLGSISHFIFMYRYIQ